jgi:uracil-DNA glycosylase
MTDFKKKLFTPYDKHRMRWTNCQHCSLSKTRQHVVLCRGWIPADILFVGEAPGASEDVLGKPFRGPAGHLLDQIIEQSIPHGLTYCITNLVACIPLDDNKSKVAEPPEDAIKACAPRLQEVYNLCRPRLLVYVGKLASKWFRPGSSGTVPSIVEIVHPAAILRMDVSQRGLTVQRSIIALEDAVASIT